MQSLLYSYTLVRDSVVLLARRLSMNKEFLLCSVASPFSKFLCSLPTTVRILKLLHTRLISISPTSLFNNPDRKNLADQP